MNNEAGPGPSTASMASNLPNNLAPNLTPKLSESLAEAVVEAESEDNSLSISLPSEGSQKSPFLKTTHQELRTGILKIFDEEENESKKGAFSDNFVDFDNVIFDEKHEFERTEKMITSGGSRSTKLAKNVSLTWSSEDQPDDRGGATSTPFDADSGFDGVHSRSSSSKDKVWSKIHKQINKRFSGSTGSLSSTSPNSEREAVSKKTSADSGNACNNRSRDLRG